MYIYIYKQQYIYYHKQAGENGKLPPRDCQLLLIQLIVEPHLLLQKEFCLFACFHLELHER